MARPTAIRVPLHLVFALIVAVALTLAVVGSASAHNLEVTHPQTGETINEVWIGGFILPEPAQSAPPMFGPFNLPPSHGNGLPNACQGTASSSAVSIKAPPFYTGCVHGEP